jgi:ribonuclease BN (tRNA processing enzyme)
VNGLTYALTGDSHYHDAEIDFLRGVDVAIIDAGHIGSAAIVELCQRTQVQRMICSHIYEELDHPSLLQQASSLGYTGKLEIAYDKMIIPF